MSEDSHIAMSIAGGGGGSHRSSTSIPSGGADTLSVNIDEHSKIGGSIDFGVGGNLSTIFPTQDAALGQSVFSFADKMGDTLAPMKFSTSAAIGPIESEMSKANLTAVTPGQQLSAGQGYQSILPSQQGGQEH